MHTFVDERADLFPPARWRGGWRAKRAGWGDFCWLGARIIPPPRPHSLRSCGRPSPPAEVGCFRLRPDMKYRTRVNPSSVGGRASPTRLVHPVARARGDDISSRLTGIVPFPHLS